MIYVTKGISEIVVKGKVDVKSISEVNHEVLKSLFVEKFGIAGIGQVEDDIKLFMGK